MFYLYHSNRLENLVEALANVIAQPLENPFEKEVIVLQSQGMQRWLSMQLAEKLGIWANGYFPFPNEILSRIFREILGHPIDSSPYEPDVMMWSLMDILPPLLDKPEFIELRHYLHTDKRDVRKFQLVQRIADTLDQYVIFRPELIEKWEKGQKIDNWQAILWQAISAHNQEYHQNARHRAAIQREFISKIENNAAQPPRYFTRISLFGIAALAPFYLQTFVALAKIIDVHFFLLNPCQEHWGEIRSNSEIARQLRRAEKKEKRVVTAEEQFLETGNSLLASMGKQARDFIDLLNEEPTIIAQEIFAPAPENSLLHHIQNNILNLDEPYRINDLKSEKIIIQPDDFSIQIHVCHSAMREVEVLHDQLLALFAADSTLTPRDILILSPEIEKYAPLIQAVFDSDPDDNRHLPFALADRSLRQEYLLINTFFMILELYRSRFTVSDILTILEVPLVQQKFDFEDNDLDLIRHWLEKTHIRWGMDAASRAALDLPAYPENTWGAGIDRLLLGYVLPTQTEELFQGILSYNEIEGDDSLVLGKLIDFIQSLHTYICTLKQSHTLSEWGNILNAILNQFFAADNQQESVIQQVRNIVQTLIENSQKAHFKDKISIEVILANLRANLENIEHNPANTQFLTGKITFCAMLPMRSIPFRVIGILGMNDRVYPRSNKPLNFDLIAAHPKKGDRSLRFSDRYLFLETFISARETFYISYIGHDIHDNSVKPPSVLVSELRDYVKQHYILANQDLSKNTITDENLLLKNITFTHPLQPFSPHYFTSPSRFFSYSREYQAASYALLQVREEDKPRALITQPLPEPEAELCYILFEQFIRFFINPAQYLLKERLQIYLPDNQTILEDDEPFILTGLDLYKLNELLVEKSLKDEDLESYRAIIKAQGILPHGNVGDYCYDAQKSEIQTFVSVIKKQLEKTLLPDLSIDCYIGQLHLIGRLNNIYQIDADNYLRLHYRYATLKAKDYLQAWFYHLVFCLSFKDKICCSRLIGIKTNKNEKEVKICEFKPVVANEAEKILRQYAQIYRQGLLMPLCFFPESAWIYSEKMEKNVGVDKAFEEARKQWEGDEYHIKAEKENLYFALCFGQEESENLLNAAFAELATEIYSPLRQYLCE